MANVYYTGAVQAVPRLYRISITGVVVGETYTVTVTGSSKFFRYKAVTGDTAALIVQGLLAAMAASVDGEVRELSGAADPLTAADFLVTGPADGATVTLTATATGAATISETAVNAATGPYDTSAVGNYSTGALPSAADNLILYNQYGPKYNTTALAAIALTSVQRRRNATLNSPIGLPDVNQGGYLEYRPRHVQLNCPLFTLETSQGEQPQTVRFECLHTGSPAAVVITGDSSNSDLLPVVDFFGTPSNSTLNTAGASCGVATLTGSTSAVVTVTAGDSSLFIGVGATIGAINVENTRIDLNANFATMVVSGSTSQVFANGSAGTATTGSPGVTIEEGTVYWRSTGVPGDQVEIGGGGTLDMRLAPNVLPTFDIYASAGASIFNDAGRITLPYNVLPQNCRLQEIVVTTPNLSNIEFS